MQFGTHSAAPKLVPFSHQAQTPARSNQLQPLNLPRSRYGCIADQYEAHSRPKHTNLDFIDKPASLDAIKVKVHTPIINTSIRPMKQNAVLKMPSSSDTLLKNLNGQSDVQNIMAFDHWGPEWKSAKQISRRRTSTFQRKDTPRFGNGLFYSNRCE